MKITLTLSAIVVALLLLAAPVALAAPAHQDIPDRAGDWDRIQEAGTLVIGTAADYPPFEFYNSNYELDGFDIELAKALGEELGVEVEFNDYAFDGLLDQVQLGEVDAAIAAISVTPERSRLVDFTNLYYVGSSAVVAGSAFTETVTSASDMAGLKVGVERGTTYQAWAQANLVDTGYIAQTDLVTYPSTPNLLTALRTGKIDVALFGKLTADLAVRSRGLKLVGEGLSAQQFAIAVPKDSSLLAPLNKALLAIESDGRLAALSELYLAETPVQDEPAAGGAVVIALPTLTPGPAQPAAVAAPDCIDSMKWITDLNLDDQNMQAPPILVPGQDFTKGWRVQNNGTCPWSADFELAYTNGNRIEASMGGSSVKIGRVVQPGETIDINVNLRAPQSYGVFQGFWRMHAPQGQSFGETVWGGVQVPDPNPPVATPAPQPPASLNPNLRADAAYIAAGQCATLRWEIDNVRSVFLVDGGATQGVAIHDARKRLPGRYDHLHPACNRQRWRHARIPDHGQRLRQCGLQHQLLDRPRQHRRRAVHHAALGCAQRAGGLSRQ